VSGEARGISTSLLIGAAFPAAALLLFAIWGRRIPIAEGTSGDDGRPHAAIH
jgi:hypothetical protein